ncbi:MAG: PQQ-binding-like beta-propeller repeat protein [Pseudomonadota bacterium]
MTRLILLFLFFLFYINADASQLAVPASNVYKKYGEMPGMLQFRGNPSHTFYGMGPVPTDPQQLWRYPERAMSGPSSVGGKTKTWVGTGWTGQPLVWPGNDGQGWEVVFGAYDHDVHFVDWKTGEARAKPFPTNDIIKGTATIDPDGYPLLYFGSRDNYFRIVALDQNPREELWKLNGQNRPGRVWNNDWDGNATIVNDHLIVGGENSLFYVIKINRGYDENGRVTVDPKIVVEMPGYNKALFSLTGDRNVSIESSVAVFENRAYFANSGGRIVGVDLDKVDSYSKPEDIIVFDFWVGDDTDASIVIDEEGMLYVAVERERRGKKSKEKHEELGQLVKLNPYATSGVENPVVWENPPIILKSSGGGYYDSGIWATPALANGYLYVPTHNGPFFIVDKDSGEVVWETDIIKRSWSSPLVVDSKLIIANCRGTIMSFDVMNPESPELEWTHKIPSGACIESTPLLWEGHIIVGTRDGFVYAIGDQ